MSGFFFKIENFQKKKKIFDQIFLKFISWSRRITLKQFQSDSDSLKVCVCVCGDFKNISFLYEMLFEDYLRAQVRGSSVLERPVGTRPSLLEITVGPQVLLGVRIEPETTMLTYAVQPKPNSPEPSRFMLSQVLIS